MILRAIVFGSLVAALVLWFLQPAPAQPASVQQSACPLYFELAPMPTIEKKQPTNLEM